MRKALAAPRLPEAAIIDRTGAWEAELREIAVTIKQYQTRAQSLRKSIRKAKQEAGL